MPPLSTGKSIATIGDLIDGDLWLSVYCEREAPACNHGASIDLHWLVQRTGRDYPCDAQSLARIGWRCSSCGSRRVSFRMSKTTPPPSTFGKHDDDIPWE